MCAAEFMPGTANANAVCCGGDMRHVSLATGGDSLLALEAGALVESQAVRRTDLACADLQQLCDAQCMEAALRALAAHTGGSYVAGDAPMRGTLLWTAGEVRHQPRAAPCGWVVHVPTRAQTDAAPLLPSPGERVPGTWIDVRLTAQCVHRRRRRWRLWI